MIHRLLVLAIACWFVPVAIAQTVASNPREQYRSRLEALTPERPREYLELAEEVADSSATAEARRLVVELYTLAFAIDLNDGGDRRLAASACKGLASVPGNGRYAAWLRALGARLSPDASPPASTRPSSGGSSESLAYRVSLVLGYIRSGDGGLARQLLAKPEIAAAMETIDRLLAQLGVSTGAAGLAREAARWPCPDCSNERIQRRPQTNPPSWRVCPLCGGLPGERLTNAELIGHLRAESFLLEGVQKSWAAQITTDQGAPLIDPIPENLPKVFGVDPARHFFRKDAWTPREK